MWFAGIPALQQAGRQVPPPSKHPGATRRSRSLHCNARKLSPIYATGNMERVGGKKTKDCELRGKALHAKIRWIRKERETRRENADGLDPKNTPCRALTDRRCHTPCSWAAKLAPSPVGVQLLHPLPFRFRELFTLVPLCANYFNFFKFGNLTKL